MAKADLIFRRVFDATPERLWRFWSDPEQFRLWWGPDHFDCPNARIDLRPGGQAVVSMQSRTLGFPEQFSLLRFLRVEPFSRIDYVHALATPEGQPVNPQAIGMPPDFPAEVLHEMTLTEIAPGRTAMLLIEKDWPVGPMRGLSELGMQQSLAKMAGAI
jgi:uncharacterized protein YndB with AHSA1/START domain